MRKVFLLLLLFSNCFAQKNLVNTEGSPSAVVHNMVNAITGDCTLFSHDLHIPGAEPIHIKRLYISGDETEENGGWVFFPHQHLHYIKEEKPHIKLHEPNGSEIFFKFCHKAGKKGKPNILKPDLEKTPLGYTNCGRDGISGRSNLKNTRIIIEPDEKIITVFAPDGTKRRYKRLREDKKKKTIKYHLIWEKLPSGNIKKYGYDAYHRLNAIETLDETWTKTFASCSIQYKTKRKKLPDFDVITSDGRKLSYQFENGQLTCVESPDYPTENYVYTKKRLYRKQPFIKQCITSGDKRLDIRYYKIGINRIGDTFKNITPRHLCINKVRELTTPTGSYRFDYCSNHEKGDYTRVTDNLQNSVLYYYNESLRLTKIERETLTELFTWGKEGNLEEKIIQDKEENTLIKKTYAYDNWGNVIEETLEGNITGHDNDSYTKRYTYTQDGRNLLLSEEDDKKKTLFTYFPDKDLPLSKLILENEKIQLRSFYEYEENLLICEIQDDGSSHDKNDLSDVTCRTISRIHRKKSNPYYGMHEVIENKYLDLSTNEEKLLKKTILSYGTGAKVTSKSIYDANDEHCYTLTFSYDKKGNLIRETNSLGQFATYGYDENFNLICHTPFHGKTREKIHYNKARKPIKKTATSNSGEKKRTYFAYDEKARCIQTIDHFGNKTNLRYDNNDNLLQTDFEGTLHKNEYNTLGHLIKKTDPLGHTTTITPNIFGKPLQIKHPDGATEAYHYNRDGSLAEYIDPEGLLTRYTYDYLGRLIKKKTHDKIEQNIYKGPHLIKNIDPAGNITSYTYDNAGRKIKESLVDLTTHHTFDPQGRLSKKQIGELIETYNYDSGDRIIKQTTQGKAIAKYSYDSFGNKQVITRFIDGKQSHETFTYDEFSRLSKHKDGEGNITSFTYSLDKVLKKTSINPRGIKTKEIHDIHGRLIKRKTTSPFGEPLNKEEYTYDANGNCIKYTNLSQTIHREYDSRNRLIKLLEAAGTKEEKVTKYTYDKCGRLKSRADPNTTQLHYTYDPFGNITSLISSDNTIHYTYTHDKLGNILSSHDHINNRSTTRTFDSLGNLLEETLANGLQIKNSYDTLYRRTTLQLPDKSFIEYSYDAQHLTKITRNNFTHHFILYDPSGNLLEEHSPLGTLNHHYNANGQKEAINSSHFRQTVLERDQLGNIRSLDTNGQITNFNYNDLSQLTLEEKNTYTYSPHHTRLTKNDQDYYHNNANQLITSGNASYSYDRTGHTIKKSDLNGTITYKYDALGQLIFAEKAHHWRTTFAYDSFHRRISKKHYVLKNNTYTLQSEQNYIYDGDLEIGALDATGQIKELRILGLRSKADIGSAVAIELNQKTYIPFHDLQGNVRRLIDPTTHQTFESYTYTAFGEEKSDTYQNPWRFHSKRHEDHLNLIFFGRRYYEPATGRFFTPDPKGFIDGVNLYNYCHANPLNKFDLMGLIVNVEWHIPLNRQTLERTLAISDFVGEMIYQLAFHLIPLRPFRQIPMFIGNLLSGRQREYVSAPAKTYKTGGMRLNGVSFLSTNGILTPFDTAKETANYYSSGLQDSSVDFTHDPTKGFASDILAAVAGKIGRQNGTSKELAKQMRELIHQLKQTTDNPALYVSAHSKGGINLKNALKLMTKEELGYIHAYTFGSASLFQNEYLGKLMHYVASNDPVPFFSPYERMKAVYAPERSNVTILPSNGRYFDHEIMGDTYREQINRITEDINQSMEMK